METDKQISAELTSNFAKSGNGKARKEEKKHERRVSECEKLNSSRIGVPNKFVHLELKANI
jgi:hypothetical protein